MEQISYGILTHVRLGRDNATIRQLLGTDKSTKEICVSGRMIPGIEKKLAWGAFYTSKKVTAGGRFTQGTLSITVIKLLTSSPRMKGFRLF
ncbi:hypothetical protein Mapa_004959 [Marchantia paleacea]|nr:hypothetical protein Mapa_004959 [Marchantia paleacea]